jgi:type I restriction enzyme S subunit
MLPEGWKRLPLGNLAKIERGRFSVRPRNDPRYYGGSIPFVQTGDVANAGMYLSDYSQTLNELGLSVSKQFPAGIILVTIAANIGATAITRFPVACPDSVVAISPIGGKADLHWLKYALEELQPELDGMADQNAQKNINLQVLAPLEIATPPWKQQQWIGKCLSVWADAIATTEKLLANSRRQKQALMWGLLSGKRRFDFPAGSWQYVDFDEVFERITQKNVICNSNVLTISGQHGLISQRDYFNKSVASVNLSGYTLLERGDFAYNKSYSTGYPMGAIKPLLAYDAGVVSSLYLCFRLRSDVDADFDFFRHYFEAGLLNEEISGIAQEGARNHGLLNVSVTDFFKLRLHIPPAPVQRKIAEAINVAEAEERWFEQELIRFQTEKRALMQQLLTGKRRVRLPATEAASA